MIVLGIIFGVQAKAAPCRISAHEMDFYYYGYAIHYAGALQDQLEKKNYQLVLETDPHTYEFTLEGKNVTQHGFDHAEVSMVIRDQKDQKMIYQQTVSKTCLMQICSLNEFKNSIVKALRKLSELETCKN